MTKKKRKANYFYNGGPVWDKNLSFGKNLGNAFNSGALNSVVGAAGSALGQGISGGFSTGAGNAMQGLSTIASAIPGPWGAIAGAGLNIVGGAVNRLFGSQINEQAVANFKNENNQLANTVLNANNYDDLLSQYSNTSLLGDINKSQVGKDGIFSNKVSRLTSSLNADRDLANERYLSSVKNSINNIGIEELLNANYAAYGGPLTMRYTGTMSPFGNTFADGGNIHIKPENRGKFTRLKERTGKSSTWYKEHGTPEQRKMATFALNARKWKHAFGGDLNTNGGDFSNGLIMIGNGGTHEENPMEGVQMGVDDQGTPNLVEEGEVIFNDYVFSNRMKVPKAVRSKYKLREKKGITFADAAKRISKESEERPNDPISQRGLDVMLGELASVQEDERLKKQMRNPEFRQQVMNQLSMQGQQQYAQGGLLGKKYAGLGASPNILGYPNNDKPYSYYGNTGASGTPTNADVAKGWSTFKLSSSNTPLYDPDTKMYNLAYTNPAFKQAIRELSEADYNSYWTKETAPDYFKTNSAPPTKDQLLGTAETPGLMYDKKYGDAHRIGLRMFHDWLLSDPDKPAQPQQSMTVYTTRNRPGGDISINPEYLDSYGYKIPDDIVDTIKDGDGNTVNYLSNLEDAIAGRRAARDKQKPETRTEKENEAYPTWMRYAPIAAAGVGVFTDALGWTNKPDYSNADAILDATANGGKYTPVSFSPLGNYLTYQPFDRNYYINKLNAQSGATRRAIVNQSAGNRATALAGLLAADYNAQGKLGDLARQAEEYNLAQKEKVATFNRGTDQFNSEMGLKAAMANQSALANLRDYRLKGTMAAAEMREKARMLADANRSANLTNFVQGLGDIGSENIGWNQLQWAIDHGVFGPMQDTPSKGYEKSRKKKNGGKLLTKKG